MENLRGATLMSLAMLGFAFEDMIIKLMSGTLPTWQILIFLGMGGSSVFALTLRTQGQALISVQFLHPMVLWRNVGEVIGTLGFVTAISLTPISSTSAVLQATSLTVTLGAAVLLKEPVGWRRWSAIGVGFAGVMLVIQPWNAGFDLNVLFAVLAVFGLGLRDLATRRVPRGVSSMQLSFLAFLSLIPAAMVLSLFSTLPYVSPNPVISAMMAGAVILGTAAYYAIVAAVRIGDVSFVTPFRYSRIIFALCIGVVVFGERPNTVMLLGAVIIVASGIYTVLRERKHRPAA